MFPKSTFIKSFIAGYIIALISVGGIVLAQSPEPVIATSSDPNTQVIEKCISLMEKEEWQQTLDILQPFIQKHKETGLKEHGAKFATAYYYQGLCQLKLAQALNKLSAKEEATSTKLFGAAIASFDQCYAVDLPKDRSNIYRAKSHLLRGNALQSLGKFQLAILSYQLFLYERHSALDSYNISDFKINLAICYWKKSLPQEASPEDTNKAITLIQESLLFTGRNEPEPISVITALGTLTEIASHLPTNPDLVTSTIERTRLTNPQTLDFSEEIASAESDRILTSLSNLILYAAQKNLPVASLHLTSLLPNISKYAAELEFPLEIKLPEPNKILANQKSIHDATAIAMLARAHSYQQSNQLTSAVQLYSILVDQYSDTKQQPENLYNLARLTAKNGQSEVAITHSRRFLKDHPQHSLRLPTLTILLNALYHNKQYKESLVLAEQILSDATATSDQSLITSASFIRPASHYYLSDFTAAAPLFVEFQKNYPGSPYHTDVVYLNAAVQNQLLNWETSVPMLREFIQSPQDESTSERASILVPFAQYDIAYAQYSQRQLHSAKLSLLPFTLDLPFVKAPTQDSQITPAASILLGNIQLLLRKRDSAVAHYERAIQIATTLKNTDSRDEAYYLLIDLLGKPLWDGLSNERLSETISHYLSFLTLENAKSSPYYTQILTSAITALEKGNLHNPTLPTQLLSQNLFLQNLTPNTPGVEVSLNTYLYYLRQNKTPTEEVIRILTEEVKTSNSSYHQALLLVSKIETLQQAQIRKPIPEHQKRIDYFYQELISQFLPKDLDNFTLLNIAKHLTKNNNLAEAESYYQAILASDSIICKIEARLGLAIQLATSKNLTPEQKKSATEQLTSIIANPLTPQAPLATAHYHFIKLLLLDEQWNALEKNALAYLKYPQEVKTYHFDVLQLLALAYDKQGPEKLDIAISTYVHIYGSALLSLEYSAPAIDRTCQLLWERNNPAVADTQEGKSDRQLAYETSYKFIRQTKDHFALRKEALPEATIQTWENIKIKATKTYPNESGVNPFKGEP